MSRESERIQELEEELIQVKERLFQTSKLAEMGRLAAVVVHELSQPLLGIKAFAQILQRRCQNDGFIQPKVEIIVQQAEVMEEILGNLRQYSRKRSLRPEPVDLSSEVDRALALFRDRAQKNKVDISVDLPPALPMVRAAPGHIQQILVNLLTNALDAVPDGETGQVVIEALRGDGGALTLVVANTGAGVPAAVQDRLFEPFFTTKPEGKGTGLGLSVCREILDLYDGRIRLMTQDEVGARFGASFGAAFEISLPEACARIQARGGVSSGA